MPFKMHGFMCSIWDNMSSQIEHNSVALDSKFDQRNELCDIMNSTS